MKAQKPPNYVYYFSTFGVGLYMALTAWGDLSCVPSMGCSLNVFEVPGYIVALLIAERFNFLQGALLRGPTLTGWIVALIIITAIVFSINRWVISRWLRKVR